MTQDTSGPPGSPSSKSTALSVCLGNKLQARLRESGSSLFRLTWKHWDMPSGRRVCRLAASVPRTSAKGSGSEPSEKDSTPGAWRRPCARDGTKNVRTLEGAKKEAIRKGWNNDLCTAALSTLLPGAWRRPCANDAKGSAYTYGNGRKDRVCLKLLGAARLASWATPAAQEAGGTPEQFLERKRRAVEKGAKLGVSLTSLSLQAQLATWATPTARDHKDGACDGTVPINGLLGRQVWLVDSGLMQTGSGAETRSIGRLAPGHSRWLMGLPEEWDLLAPKG